jgi:hypoxanthine phosphoribosyltransferase
VLIAREEISARVSELGRAIAREHAESVPLLVGVLKGAAVFMADLIRAIPSPVALGFMGVSAYG